MTSAGFSAHQVKSSENYQMSQILPSATTQMQFSSAGVCQNFNPFFNFRMNLPRFSLFPQLLPGLPMYDYISASQLLNASEEQQRKKVCLENSRNCSCSLCGELLLSHSYEMVNDHFAKLSQEHEGEVQKFMKSLNEKSCLQNNVDNFAENRNKTLHDARLNKRERRKKRYLAYVKQESVRSKDEDDTEEDNDLDVASNEPNEVGSTVSSFSPSEADSEYHEKRTEKLIITSEVGDCHNCGKRLLQFDSRNQRQRCLACSQGVNFEKDDLL